MSSLAERLNEVLAVEWACVRALRRAETKCEEPGPLEIIRRVRKDCSVNCVNLAHAVRAIGGRPTDIPSPRFSLQLKDETVTEILDLAQSAQRHIIAEITALLDEPDVKAARPSLALVLQLHREDLRWLDNAR